MRVMREMLLPITREISMKCLRMWNHSGAGARLEESWRKDIFCSKSQRGLPYKQKKDDEKNDDDNVDDALKFNKGQKICRHYFMLINYVKYKK